MPTARTLLALALLAVLLVLPPRSRADGPPPPHQPAITPTAEVGTLAASFAVTDAGTASYRIPLELPPGTHGLTPALALAYDSAAGNGPVGVGWSLAADSSIGRCAPNLALDGEVGPIAFTDSDPLCLDGERLVVVEGTAWTPGAVYAKRHDDLARVRLTSASACAGQLGFEVRSADGLIHTYGCSEDSLVRTPRGILRWSISRTTDRFGNFIDFAYDYADVEVWSQGGEFEGFARVDHRLAYVDYGGHEGEPALDHDTRVFLRWEDRPDVARGWFAGGVTAATQRLQGVAVYRDNLLVRRWPLTYEQGETTGRSRLIGVTECAGDGACKPATTFDWIEGETELDDLPFRGWSFDGSRFPYLYDLDTISNDHVTALAQVTLDANGDGMSDLFAAVGEAGMFMYEGRGWELWRSQPDAAALLPDACGSIEPLACQPGNLVIDQGDRSRWLSFVISQFLDHIPQPSFALDADGDGRDDVVAASAEGLLPEHHWAIASLVIASSPAEGVVTDRVLPIATAGAPAWIYAAADLTGDGLGDLVWCSAHDEAERELRIGSWRVLANVPELGLDPAFAVDTGERCSAHDKLHLLDHDGDGVRSLLVVRTWDDDAHQRLPASKWQDYHALQLAPELDAFGWQATGLPPDLAQRWRVSLDQLSIAKDFPLGGAPLSSDRVIDVQGDGLPDLIRFELAIGDADSQAITAAFGPSDALVDPIAAGLRLWINDGVGFRDAGWVTIDADGHALWQQFQASNTIDHQGDGRLDLMMPDVDDQTWQIWSRTDAGSFAVEPLVGAPPWYTSGSNFTRAIASMDVDGDGLHDPIFWDWAEEQFWDIRRHRGESPDRITRITDGLGQRTVVEYASTTDHEHDDLYTPRACAWPADCQERAQIVVTRHFADAGLIGGSHEFEHRYAGSRTDRLEGRWLGFAEHEVTQSSWFDGTKHTIGHRKTWFANAEHDEALATSPRAGIPVMQIEQLHDPETGERYVEVHQWDHAVISTSPLSFRVVETDARVRSYELPSCFGWCTLADVDPIAPLSHAWSTVGPFDTLGFALFERHTTELHDEDDGFDVVEQTRVIEHDLASWSLGHVTHETLTSFADEPVTRTRAFTYEASTGALASASVEPDDAALTLTATFTRDAFGNVIAEQVADALGEVRVTTTGFDARGRFPTTLTNALGHVTRVQWHARLAVPHTATDPNGVRQIVDVDAFGRTTGVRVFAGEQPRGDALTIRYEAGAVEGLQIHASALGHGERTLELDRLGRPVVERWLGPEGLTREQRTHYDALGNVARIDAPRFVGDPSPGSDVWTWDLRGRPRLHTRLDGAFERWLYVGRTIEHRDFEGRRTIEHHDGAGRTIESERAPGLPERERICFDYGAFSQLIAARLDCIDPDLGDLAPPAGEAPPAIERFEYDTLGRLAWSNDPSQGETSYVWTAFGELRSSFDANERLVEYEYDALGRLLARIDDEGVASWLWDLGPIGTLGAAISPSGVTTSRAFDAFARPIALSQEIAGESFTVRLDYDGHDRVRAIHYPQVAELPAIAVRNLYGEDGSLVGVRRLADDHPIWQIDEVDVEGRVVRESFTNGVSTTRTHDPQTGDLLGLHTTGPQLVQDLRYAWSDAGQLLAREDLRGEQSESFAYDPLGGLAFARAQRGASVHERHFAYDTLGNLVHATDVGDYEYDVAGRLRSAGTTTQQWDAAGNLIHRVAPEGEHRFVWTSFDKLAALIPADGEPTRFDYDADQHRVRRHDLEAQIETVFAFGLYERDRTSTKEGTREVHRHFVFGRDRVVAELAIELDPEGVVAERSRYLHDDHLGSVDVVTDEQGQVAQRLAFDAWGKPRDPDDWTVPDEFGPELLVNRGYTGHAGRRDAGLVDMGGRLYDPRLGRMVNADPFVVAPSVAIGWNRFAYVLDDPLSLTDPSGYWPDQVQVTKTKGADGRTQRQIYTQTGWEATYEVIAQREGGSDDGESAGESTDAGPSVDGRGDTASADASSDTSSDSASDSATDSATDLGLGLADGFGNTGYIAGSGAAMFIGGPVIGAVSVVGFWATGGNPAGAARRFIGELIGSDMLSADPSSVEYSAGLMTGELVSGGVAGMARGMGSTLRALAVGAGRSCARGSCGRAGTGMIGRLVDLASDAKCFVAGTLVDTPEGPRAIETLAVGDWVWAARLEGAAIVVVARRVVAVHERVADERLRLGVRSDDGERSELEVTPEHPIFDAGLGRYVWAEDLRPGAVLVLGDGRRGAVESVARVSGEALVYNLEVEVSHNYFAGGPGGDAAILVHNGKYPTQPYKRPSGATTKTQRASVQGKPCVKCGTETERQVAGHKKALVEEYYENGAIDRAKMRDVDAVQPECPTCSAQEGAAMSRYSRAKKQELGIE